MSRFVNPVPQFYLNNGDIASAGKLYFYETGTTTKKDTFSDFAQSIKNTNPVILSGEGRCPNIFGEGRFTVVFKDKDDIEQWSRDDVELSVELGQYADWSAVLTYRINDIVRGSDGEYYRSLTNTNTGNDPTTSATNWEKIAFISEWNTNATYQTDDNVFLNGLLYVSEIDDNTGNQPDSSDTDVWADASEPRDWLSARTYQTNDIVIHQGTLYRSTINDNNNITPGTTNDWQDLAAGGERIELTGSTFSISSGFNNTYWFDGASDLTLTIDAATADEGATETIILNQWDATADIILDEGAGVALLWAFDNSLIPDPDGYRIRPGETLRLVNTLDSDTYNVFADNGVSQRVELGGDFTAGEEVIFTRTGSSITMIGDGVLSHSGGSSPNSATLVVPALFRPDVQVENTYTVQGDGLYTVAVTGGGQVNVTYRDFTGSTLSRTDTGLPPVITYSKADNY